MIRKAKESDLEAIARLHSESFENHFLPKLGIKLLSKYYKEFINDNNIFIVCTDESDNIIGLLLGTPDSSVGKKQFIRNNFLKLFLRVVKLCLFLDRDTWNRVIEYFKNVVISKVPKKKAEEFNKTLSINTLTLLSLCVSTNAKGTGVSQQLVKVFEQIVKKSGYEGYTLTVHKDNDRANAFYRKMDMSIYKESHSEYGYIKNI
ncbi:MAG: GNAT family N-acetyltransferase [Clostridiaceae bacterium]|nr:GNAT family N-acetyltransferase [Clostridiaceae bacterium]